MKTTFDHEDLQAVVSAVIEGLKPFLSGRTGDRIDDTIFDVPGLCQYLKVTPKWIHERTHLKEIPYYKGSNKMLRFRKRDIDKWLESIRTPAIGQYAGKLKAIK